MKYGWCILYILSFIEFTDLSMGPYISILISNGIGVESTFRGMKIHFLCHIELWQVFLCTRELHFINVLHLVNLFKQYKYQSSNKR